MRALVIGADGFAGRWLVRHLLEAGDAVVGAAGPRFVPPLEGVTDVARVDVRDGAAVHGLVAEAGADAIYYLAGVSGRESREDADAAIGITVNGVINVIRSCASLARPPRLLFVSTSYVYGFGTAPMSEDAPERPAGLYPAAKLAAERALAVLGPQLGIHVVTTRPFNHIGPGQRDTFLVPTIAKQVANAARDGQLAEVHVRDASVVRDFTDVRDVVRAYRLMVERGAAGGTYNVASGVGRSVAEVAELLGRIAGVEVRMVQTDPSPAGETDVMVGDARRVRALGWRPEHDLNDTLRDILDACLAAP